MSVHSAASGSVPTCDDGRTAPHRLTLEEIEAGRSPAGGWTRDTLARWGVQWPPPKGWKEALLAGDDSPFGEYVPEPVDPDIEAWARALCVADDVSPDKVIGAPALPMWRSYVQFARVASAAAKALGTEA